MKFLSLRICLAIAFVGVALATGSSALAQQNTLRWNFEAGQKFKIETTQDQTQTIGMPTGEMEMKMVQGIFMMWEVKSVDGDKFTIGQTITRMKMSMDSAMMQMEYDSEEGDAEGMAAGFASAIEPMINEEITFVMDSRGNVTDVKVPESLAEELKAGGGGMAGMGAPGPEMLEQMAKQSAIVFPEGPVTGDSEWENKTTQKTMVEMTVANKYKYLGQEDSGGNMLHKISVTSDVTLDSNEIPGGAGSVELDKMESSGNIWFDNNNGYMPKAVTNQTMVMLVEAMGQEMDVAGSVKTEVKMTPIKD